MKVINTHTRRMSKAAQPSKNKLFRSFIRQRFRWSRLQITFTDALRRSSVLLTLFCRTSKVWNDGHKKAKNRMKGRKTKSEFHVCSSCQCRPRRWSPSRVNHNTYSLQPLRSIFASVSRALFGLLCSTVFLLTPLFSLLLPVIKSLHDRREVEWRPLPKRRFQFLCVSKNFLFKKSAL